MTRVPGAKLSSLTFQKQSVESAYRERLQYVSGTVPVRTRGCRETSQKQAR